MYLIVLSGMSGAGKSHALHRLEDMGFFCVDNLPGEMLGGFATLCLNAQPPIERAAVVVDSRERVFNPNIQKNLAVLAEMGLRYDVLFLDCRDEVIKRRYGETRRRHPMDEDLSNAISKERSMLMPVRESANFIIDTSDLRPMELAARLSSLVSENVDNDFILTLESFGYKRGVPMEADMVVDMRFVANPFYEPELRHLSGLDEPVKKYLEKQAVLGESLAKIEELIRQLIPNYILQDKHQFTVAFGCTGGRHRSVYAAQAMHEKLKDNFYTRILHRDIQTESLDIILRTGKAQE